MALRAIELAAAHLKALQVHGHLLGRPADLYDLGVDRQALFCFGQNQLGNARRFHKEIKPLALGEIVEHFVYLDLAWIVGFVGADLFRNFAPLRRYFKGDDLARAGGFGQADGRQANRPGAKHTDERARLESAGPAEHGVVRDAGRLAKRRHVVTDLLAKALQDAVHLPAVL